jgi:hypothetical protein
VDAAAVIAVDASCAGAFDCAAARNPPMSASGRSTASSMVNPATFDALQQCARNNMD